MGTWGRSGLHKAFEATPQNTMSSGYGQYGGVGRCFPFWQDVLACYVVNTSAEDDSERRSGLLRSRTTMSVCTTRRSTLALWRCRLLLSDKARPTIPMHRPLVK